MCLCVCLCVCFRAYCPLVASLFSACQSNRSTFPSLFFSSSPPAKNHSIPLVTLNSTLQPLRPSCGLRKQCLVFVVDSQAEAVQDDAYSVATGTDGKQRGKKNKHNKCPNKRRWCQGMNARGEICWEMLESAADAFGWINPFLRQMAPSPCRADKPQSVLHPLLHFCVRAFFFFFVWLHVCRQKKKSGGEAAAVLTGWWWWCRGLWTRPAHVFVLPPKRSTRLFCVFLEDGGRAIQPACHQSLVYSGRFKETLL